MKMRESEMSKHNKAFSTSKLCILTTGSIFICIIIAVFILINYKQDMLDTAIYGTMITVSGTIFGSNLCWYSKKAASENHYKLRMSMYVDTVTQRLYFNEEMMKLKIKYNMSDEDIEAINGEGDIDELMDDSLQSVKDKLDNDREDYESPNELRNDSI